jgi:hypothetical protein
MIHIVSGSGLHESEVRRVQMEKWTLDDSARCEFGHALNLNKDGIYAAITVANPFPSARHE